MMTAYEHGFLTKCAEYGLPYGTAISLLKAAQSPDPLSYGSPNDPFAGSEVSAIPDAADYNPSASGSGAIPDAADAPAPPSTFQPNEQQQKLQASWDKMTAEGQAKNLSRIGITQQQFDSYTPQQRYEAMDKMRNAWMQEKQKAKTVQQQQPKPAQRTVAQAQPRQPKPTDMVSYKGSMIPRADYERIMANKSKELTPQQIQQNRIAAVGRGWQIQHQQQEARYAQTRGRQPRDANGNLRTISLSGRPTSPYVSRQGVRGIPRAAGT